MSRAEKQTKKGNKMNKEQITEIIMNNTTADTLGEAVDVYYGLFASIDTSAHTREDVLNDIREALTKGDTKCAVFAPGVNVEIVKEGSVYCATSDDYPGANGMGGSEEEAVRDLRVAYELLREDNKN